MVWDCDLHAHAFVNEANSWGEDICIRMDQVFSHIKYRYSLLNKIGCALERFQEAKIDEFRNTLVPDRGEGEFGAVFTSSARRRPKPSGLAQTTVLFTTSQRRLFHSSRRTRRTKPQPKGSKNAWRFALDLQLNVLRDMSREGVEHAGIEGDDTDWILSEHLEYCNCLCRAESI